MRLLATAVLVVFLSGCTISANATPAEPTQLIPSQSRSTPAPTLSPVEAANATLKNLYGTEGVDSVVMGVASTDNGLVVTLTRPATTLGTAEAYWRICSALLVTLRPAAVGGTVPAVLVAQPDGKVIVRADANEAACKLG